MATQAVTETFQDVASLIWKLSHQHVKKYGGELHEVFQEACLHFMYTYHTYRSDKGAFTTACQFLVTKRLLETRRKELRRNEKLKRVEMPQDIEESTSKFDVDSFLDSLPPDVEEIAWTVLNLDEVQDPDIKDNDGTPKSIKKALTHHLKKFGWTVSRIKESFKQIKNYI